MNTEQVHPSQSSPIAKQAMARNMIEQHIRPWNVGSTLVLDALAQIHREDFVPDSHAQNAFADIQIPLPGGAVMLEPKLVARMIQALDIQPEQRVLQIGVGAGYSSALLSRIVNQVTVVVDDEQCAEQTMRNLAMAGIGNVVVEQGDATNGWPQAGEFDAILIRGAVSEVSPKLFEQLAQGGRLVAIVGTQAPMELMQYRKHGDDITEVSVVDTFVPSINREMGKGAFVF